ncbi:hypothetical protein BDW42DRAFT_73216 [Aspergillus taichungensis]|uniref:Cytochrome P450 n=1 Tax=Aspergillus taichungensis TaxID=482145 RepID=A0A2J5HZK9_9EURO|nr:hypothetical protein BDW42DRAFT_73216 [Aspergillus taichungensis]
MGFACVIMSLFFFLFFFQYPPYANIRNPGAFPARTAINRLNFCPITHHPTNLTDRFLWAIGQHACIGSLILRWTYIEWLGFGLGC